MMSFESFVTRRYLKVKHQRKLVSLITILAILGVAVGVMVLVVVIGVMTGFQSELKRRILGVEAHMLVMRYSGWIENHKKVMALIEAVDGVQNVTPFVYGQGMLRTAGGVSGLVLRGIDSDRTAIQLNTKGGKTLPQMLAPHGLSHETGIVLGSVLAEKLKLAVGDGAMLMVVGGRQAEVRQLPRMHRLKVVGLFETGMYQYDDKIAYVHMHQLQRMIGIGDLVTGFEVRVADPDHVEAITARVVSKLGLQFWANHWKQMHRNLFSMLALQKLMMYVILTLIIVVAAFNVASALIMMVREKTKDIAIMKAMGASHASLKRIFLGKGIIIGSVGIGIGVLAGLGVCLILARYQFIELPGDVYFLTTLPVELNLLDLGVIALGTMMICVFASFYPAKQAAKMNPVDAIRYG
ncbi:MAG: ABC transporter permease [Desulfobacteraceae bacterium]|jgi:lipoprotein-releasing system permease protein